MILLTEEQKSKIWRVLDLPQDRQAILLHYPDAKDERHPDEVNKNLICVDHLGSLLWQVSPPPPFQPSGDPFVHLEYDGAILKATRFFGDVCEIDIESGTTKIVGWSK